VLSVTNEFASRLHQAYILSSEQHATDPHCTALGRRRKFISILCPQYFYLPRAEKYVEKARANRLFGKQRDPLGGIIIDGHVSGWVSHTRNDWSGKDEKDSSEGRGFYESISQERESTRL